MKSVKCCVNYIIKSAEDEWLYRCLELQNDMKVLFIEDSSTDKSAASLDIKVGKLCCYLIVHAHLMFAVLIETLLIKSAFVEMWHWMLEIILYGCKLCQSAYLIY
jgi:hypothetical protein